MLEVFWKSNWISNAKTNVDYSFVNACNSKCHCDFTCAKFNMISVWPPAQCNLTQKKGHCGLWCSLLCFFLSLKYELDSNFDLNSFYSFFLKDKMTEKGLCFSSVFGCYVSNWKNSNNEDDFGELLRNSPTLCENHFKSDPIKLTGTLKPMKWDFCSCFNGNKQSWF